MKSKEEIKKKADDVVYIMMDVGTVEEEKLHSFYAGIAQALAWVLDDEEFFSMRGKDIFFREGKK